MTFKGKETTHHIYDVKDDVSSRSSRSSTTQRSPSPSDAGKEEDAYMAEETDYTASKSSDHRTPQLPIEEFEYSDEDKSRHTDTAYYESRKPRKGWKSYFPKSR